MWQRIAKRESRAAVLFISLGLIGAPVIVQSAETAPAQTAAASTAKVSPAFLAEVRAQVMQRLRLTASEADTLTSKLSSMNFNQVGGLVTGNASALQALFTAGQGIGTDAKTGTQGAVNQSGVATSSGGNATERMLSDTKNLRGGFTDGGRGNAQEGGKDCQACAGTGTGSRNNTDPAADGGDPIKTQNGGKIYVYPDGSFVIQDKNGKQEVYDKNYKARTDDPRWTANKTPVPDGEGGRRSGLISAAEWRTLLGRLGSRGAPEANKSSGAGCTVATTRTTAGTPIEVQTKRVVDTVQLQEILRIAAEKFGPKLR